MLVKGGPGTKPQHNTTQQRVNLVHILWSKEASAEPLMVDDICRKYVLFIFAFKTKYESLLMGTFWQVIYRHNDDQVRVFIYVCYTLS